MAKNKTRTDARADEVLLFVLDDESLMERGTCNSKPPHVVAGRLCGHQHHRRWNEQLPNESCYMCQHPDEAVALIWEGEVLPLGVAFLAHIAKVRIDYDMDPAVTARRVADIAERAYLGTRYTSRENS